MPRRLRCTTGGCAYHVLNRAVDRGALFHKDGDCAAFETVLRQAKEWRPVRLLAYTLMPNHWHLVLWPKRDGDLSEFLRWLTVTHTQRYRAHTHSEGAGPVYQGRFKSFPIQEDEHLFIPQMPLWQNCSYSCDHGVGELSAPKVWRYFQAGNAIVTRSIGLALNGPFCIDPAGRRGFRDPQAAHFSRGVAPWHETNVSMKA
jgi:REP element-mobilizing transposase RayT